MLPPEPIRVLVADSHEMSRYGLRIFLETFDDLKLVREAQNRIEILSLCAQLQPDVILMSVSFNFSDGIETIRTLHECYPQVSVVVLSSLYQPQDLDLALEAGAKSFLMKGMPIGELAEAIREASH